MTNPDQINLRLTATIREIIWTWSDALMGDDRDFAAAFLFGKEMLKSTTKFPGNITLAFLPSEARLIKRALYAHVEFLIANKRNPRLLERKQINAETRCLNLIDEIRNWEGDKS